MKRLTFAFCLTAIAVVAALSVGFGLRPTMTAKADILERPPYRKDYARRNDNAKQLNTAESDGVYDGLVEPLYVLPAFLMMPDLAPESERPRDVNNMVGNDGKPLDLDVAGDHDLAFESNPFLVGDKWRESWRKVHGMRFTHKDAADDESMSRMLRYDQVHRIAGGPTSYFPPPYQPPVDKDGHLFADILGRIPKYERPRWDGFAYMAFDTVEDLKISFGQGKFPAKIVPEEQIIFRSVPHMIAKEFIILPSPFETPPIVLVKIHVRPDGVSRKKSQDLWLNEHADLVLGKQATHRYVKRYAQLHNVGPNKEGELFWHRVGSKWDGITVMHFATMNDCEDFLMTPDYQEIEKHERQFNDPAKSEYFTSLNYNIIKKILPEKATRRD